MHLDSQVFHAKALVVDGADTSCETPLRPVTCAASRSGIASETGFIKTMAAGNVQRVWFEEMIHALRSKWKGGLPCEELIRLSDELDEMLQQIRAERKIRLLLSTAPNVDMSARLRRRTLVYAQCFCQSLDLKSIAGTRFE